MPSIIQNLLFFYFPLTLEPEWNGDYSKDFPSFPLKKPKLEVDRDEVLNRPLYIKQDSEEFSLPSKLKCPVPCAITQPKVKVHFLGLKKVSIKEVTFKSLRLPLVSVACLSKTDATWPCSHKPVKSDSSIPDGPRSVHKKTIVHMTIA